MSLKAIRQYVSEHPLRIEKVETEGLTLYVREMNAQGMNEFMSVNASRETDEFSARHAAMVIAIHLCDEKGVLDSESDGHETIADELQALRFSQLTSIFTACLSVSGLTGDEVEEAEGN
jgi:hypothetical protein